MRKLLVIQPYVPTYRVPFFNLLADRLGHDGIGLSVAAPHKSIDQAQRGDSTGGHIWHVPTKARSLSTPVATFNYYGTQHLIKDCDAIVAPAAATCLDTHWALFASAKRTPVGLWGHIAAYIAPSNPIDRRIEKRMLRRADHVFAYTPGGAAAAIAQGIPVDHVTTLMNSVDIEELRRSQKTLQPQAIEAFRRQHGLSRGKVAAVVGSIDESKRVNYLRDALEDLWKLDPEIKVLVGGEGAESHLLEDAAGRGQAILLGRIGAKEKALIASQTNLLLNPGRIGLVAVDALCLNLRILTSDWKWHAPEVEYLSSDEDLVVCAGPPEEYARATLALLGSPAPKIKPVPELGDMAAAFALGVRRMLDRAR